MDKKWNNDIIIWNVGSFGFVSKKIIHLIGIIAIHTEKLPWGQLNRFEHMLCSCFTAEQLLKTYIKQF